MRGYSMTCGCRRVPTLCCVFFTAIRRPRLRRPACSVSMTRRRRRAEAWRKGRSWGTILIDLETRRPVDLLPDRTSASVSAWLRAHPGVEVVARDRSTQYARAITEGAPDAVQIADRWHLLHNLRQVLARHLTSVRGRLKALPGAEHLPTELTARRQRSRAEQAASAAARERHLARYIEVRRLHAEDGLNVLQISKAIRINRTTVRGQERPWRISRPTPSPSEDGTQYRRAS